MKYFLAMTSKAKSWTATEVKRACRMCMASSSSLHMATVWMHKVRTASLRITTICLRRTGRKVYSRMTCLRFTCFRVETIVQINSNRSHKMIWCWVGPAASSSYSIRDGFQVLVAVLRTLSLWVVLVVVHRCLVLAVLLEATSSIGTRARTSVL